MQSIFMDKYSIPTEGDLKRELGNTITVWNDLSDHVHELSPKVQAAWHYSGAKYGWSFRISDSKRVLLYLLPRHKFFKVALTFGPKALDQVNASDIADSIKSELRHARSYSEGTGIRIDVTDNSLSADIRKLIAIKVKAL